MPSEINKPFLQHVRLYAGDPQFLVYVANRGGRVEFDKTKVAPDVVKRLDRLVGIFILKETPIIGRPMGVVWFELTDMGKNLIDQLKAKGIGSDIT